MAMYSKNPIGMRSILVLGRGAWANPMAAF